MTKFKTSFTGGVSYYPDHWPETEWERDLRLIRDSGLELVRFGEFSWSWYEPQEGRFDFRGFDRFLDIAGQLGLKILLCTPTAAAPPWLLSTYPEAYLLDNQGRSHGGGRHMACWNEPTARSLAQRVVATVAQRYKDHPSLYGWQIDNEPTLGESSDLQRLYGYNPCMAEQFRAHLQRKFGAVAALNDAWVNNFWSRAYAAWDEIDPPTQPGNPALWLEWLRFRQTSVSELVHWQRDMLRELNPAWRLGVNIPVCGPIGSALHGQDYWSQAEGLDFVGTDVYCFQRDVDEESFAVNLVSDLVGSVAAAVGGEYWVTEAQGGPHRLPWRVSFAGGLWGTEFHRRCALTFARKGAKKLLYFLWRPVRGGQEFGWNGLVEPDGSPNDLSRAIPGILEEARQITPEAARRKAYLHYANDSFMLSSGFDPDRAANTTMDGWYRLLDACGFQIRHLDDHGLASHPWNPDELLVLPYSLVLGESAATGIGRALKDGATVVAGFGTGFFTADGTIATNQSLELGIKLRAFDSIPRHLAPHVAGHPELPLDVMLGDFEAPGAEPLLADSNGKPLLVRNANVLYCGFDLGTLYRRADDVARQSLARTMADILRR